MMRTIDRIARCDGEVPIPLDLPPIAGWKEIPVAESDEPLVALGVFSEFGDIFTSSVYVGEHANSPYATDDTRLDGTLTTQFVREDVAYSLRAAQQLLPRGHRLVVFDAYRSLEVQTALYQHYYNQLAAQRPDLSPDALSQETQRYVSLPSTDPSRPSPHNTGGAVDLAIFSLPPDIEAQLQLIEARLTVLNRSLPAAPTAEQEARDPLCRERYTLEMTRQSLIREHGRMLEFGTPFDHGGEEAGVAYYERAASVRTLADHEVVARRNRRLLYGAMVAVGLQPYEEEWWHFNAPQSQMGAKIAGRSEATYGAARLSEENMRHEMMRRMHLEGAVSIYENPSWYHRKWANTLVGELIQLTEVVVRQTGHPRAIRSMGRAAIIEPPSL